MKNRWGEEIDLSNIENVEHLTYHQEDIWKEMESEYLSIEKGSIWDFDQWRK